MLEIADILNKYPSSVSGGQQQRASLGRALVRKAGLYLLDEPMGQLEPQLRAVLRGRIKHYLREHDCTTILVTHDQTEANALADRIAVMEGGVLQQYATPAELKARPANLFVGTFIGEPPMNVFPVRRSRSDGNAITFGIDGSDASASVYPTADFSAELRQRLQAGAASLMLGVRPHALHIGAQGLKGRVVSCQWLGDQTHVAVEIAGRTVVSVSHEQICAKRRQRDRFLSIAPQRTAYLRLPATARAIAHGATLGMTRRHSSSASMPEHRSSSRSPSRRAASSLPWPPSPTATTTLANGGVEQDMARTWSGCGRRRCASSPRKSPNLANRVIAIAVTGQGDGMWLIDKDGEPVAPAWLWLDARAASIAEEFTRSARLCRTL